ncbi:hypothetical protein JVU11DRAFT_5491 [Chiua virens]|nr:hypothetical protein JVU11DRAFT_5491 [Chiua virens]
MMKFTTLAFCTLIFSSLVFARQGPSLQVGRRATDAYSHVTTTTTKHAATPTSSCDPSSSTSTDPQTSLTLLSSLIASNFAHNGSSGGTTASRISTNNFINWCATVDLPITNGQQIHNGSCNPAPMGAIPAVTKIPSVKFVTPHNLATILPNTTFEIKLAVKNFATGWFVNPNTNYYAAPQQLDPTTGLIQGHVHVVVEALVSLAQTTPTDPTKYTAFVPFNEPADADGYLRANVTGLPKGIYKMSTIMASSNHQALMLPVAVRGSSDDAIYLTVSATVAG